MEREQIIKALECCKTPKCSNCAECPERQMLTGTDCMEHLITNTLALIHELTEDTKAKDETITNLIETIKGIQADTVRKMQERLKDGHTTAVNPNVICLYESELDQIAKEMLEETES